MSAVLCQGGNPAVVMAGTVKCLNISDASRAAFASLQPVAFVPFKLLLSVVQTSLLLLLQHLLQCISIYRKLLELPLLQPVAVTAVTTNVTAPAISETGVLPVFDLLPTANADTTPVI